MLLFGSSAAAYVTWVTGTAVGALWGDALGDPHDLGLDALFPAFFLGLLLNEARSGRARGVAALGARDRARAGPVRAGRACRCWWRASRRSWASRAGAREAVLERQEAEGEPR